MSQPNSPYIIRAGDSPAYSPANHAGTTNRRLVAPGINGARYLEILEGTLEPGGGAEEHAHPAMEQATYVLEGEARVIIDGVESLIKTGDMLFFPAGVFHEFKVDRGRLRLLVIYAPPYGEDPDKVVKRPKTKA
jgi:quercetin dioxygenase-like cupin family protein